MSRIGSVRLLVSAAGNEFMLDIARSFKDGFERGPVDCHIVLDERPAPPQAGLAQLVVAPHEYFPLFLERHLSHGQIDEVLGDLYLLNVEQPGSQWFETAWEYARRAKGVFDINRAGTLEFLRRGIDAWTAPLGLTPSTSAGASPPLENRPLDVVFLGHNSRRREEFLARHADFFSAHNCYLVLTDVACPRRLDTPGYYSGEARQQLLWSSKILLNVHSSERRYFETHRALLAISHACLLVTETSTQTAPLVGGEHFATGPLDALPALCGRYLNDIPRLQATVGAAQRLATEQLDMRVTCEALVARMATLESSGSTAVVREQRAKSEEARRREVRQRLAESQKTRASGKRDWDVISNRAYQASDVPAVSVLITLYNYRDFVEQCLTSVLQAEPLDRQTVEIVVVDDASSDGSAEYVERLMSSAATPIALVRKHWNSGLADARNVALEVARGPYAFVLDADNWIYPSCLRVLRSAFSETNHAAVYSLIQRIDGDTNEPLGLASKYDWNVRDLVQRPYIDAMAMFERGALLSVGGYSTELIDHGWFGWEDYDLWLKLALAGRTCRLVPRILSAYRVHSNSMLNATNRSVERIARHFETKFQRLVSQHPGLDTYFGIPVVRPAAPAPAPVVADAVDHAQRAAQLEQQVRALHASLSWRVTAPLRLAYRLLTGRP
jgi:GT2 family glycosyltransferase